MRFQIIFRINISDLLYASELITVVLEIINAVFRLCHIQPEEFGTLIIIIFLDLLGRQREIWCTRMVW